MSATVETQTSTATFSCPECAITARFRAKAESGDALYVSLLARREGKTCTYCAGAGEVVVDTQAIAQALVSSRGKNKGTFRASRPKLVEDGGVYGAAYVWRMIRFHNGMDMHMPVMAQDYLGMGWTVHADERALIDHLDAVIDELGAKHFGKIRMLSGASRWGQALGFEGADQMAELVDATVGLPMGNGSAIGGMEDSPEAAVEAFSGDSTWSESD